jgi:periplasmic divalent cation tolerance protein
MVPSPDVRIVLSTAANKALAAVLAKTLLDRSLAACVNVIPGALSFYDWQGGHVEDEECLLIVKTTADRLERLEADLTSLHSYQVPEFLVFTPECASEAYLHWLRATLARDPGARNEGQPSI